MLGEFQTCTPVMALFRPWLSARSVLGFAGCWTNGKLPITGSVSEKYRVVTVLLKLRNFVVRKNWEGIFFADTAQYMSQSTRRAEWMNLSMCNCPSQAATSMHSKRHGKEFFLALPPEGIPYFGRSWSSQNAITGGTSLQ